MNCSIVIATHGEEGWSELAWSQAYPSAREQGAVEVIVEHHADATLAGSRNTAARSAAGEWLCFLDADDQLADGYLDAMAHAFTEGAIFNDWSPLLVPAVQYVKEGRCVGAPSIPDWGRPIEEINCAVIGTLVRRSMFFDVGGFGEWPLYEDWALWRACVRAGAALVPVEDAVYCAHVNPQGRNSRGDGRKTYEEIRRHFGDIS